MAEPGQTGIEEKQSPAWRKIRIFYSAPAQAPDQIDEADYCGGVERDSEEGVGEAAMMRESEGWAAEAAENIQIRSLCGERQYRRGQRCLAVQASAAHACTSQEMGDRFQAVFPRGLGILFGRAGKCQPAE